MRFPFLCQASLLFLSLAIGMLRAENDAAPDGALETASPALLANGDFEKDGGAGWPAEWPHPAGASWEAEDGNHFLRLQLLRPTQFLSLPRMVKIRPGEKAYRLSVRARYKEMHYGRQIWWDGRVILEFKDDAGNRLLPTPQPPHWNKHSRDWQTYTSEFVVPHGATQLLVMPSLIRVKSGTLDLDDLTLEPIPPEPVLARQKAAAEKAAERAAKQVAEVKAKVPPVPPGQRPPVLHVAGNRLETADGKTVWLQGIAIPSLEWSESGEHLLQSAAVAIRDWKANCIRLPLKGSFWFGKGPYRQDGGAQYRQTVEDMVNFCAANGAYIVLDLHGFNAPAEADEAFWKDAARRYKNRAGVLFELFNEPYGVSWEVWRSGGMVTPPKEFADAPPEDQVQPRPFRSVGMQRLVDAVRETGAKNLVIAGGLDWGYDLSGVVQGYALEERGGNGILYSSHLYPWKKDWMEKTLAAAAKYPVFVGEVGAPPDYKGLDFIKPEERYPLEGWVGDTLGLIQKYQLHWTA